MNVKSLILFVGGLVIGGAAGVLGTKKYFNDKYEEMYQENVDLLERYRKETERYKHKDQNTVSCTKCIYCDKDAVCRNYGDLTSPEEPENCPYYETEEDEVNPIESDSVPGGRMSPEERRAVKEKLTKNWDVTTNYAAMYKGGSKSDDDTEDEEYFHGLDYPVEDINCKTCQYCRNGHCEIHGDNVGEEDSCSEYRPCFRFEDKEAFDAHQRDRNKPPKIISLETYEGLPAHIEQSTLYFYAFDEVLADENEEMVEDPERLIGDSLTKYGFADNEERLIFVMNYATDTCYEVQKIDASWTDSH